MRINENVLDKYQELQRRLPEILQAHGILQSHVLSEIDMHRKTFKLKVDEQKFTVHELRKIVEIINKNRTYEFMA